MHILHLAGFQAHTWPFSEVVLPNSDHTTDANFFVSEEKKKGKTKRSPAVRRSTLLPFTLEMTFVRGDHLGDRTRLLSDVRNLQFLISTVEVSDLSIADLNLAKRSCSFGWRLQGPNPAPSNDGLQRVRPLAMGAA